MVDEANNVVRCTAKQNKAKQSKAKQTRSSADADKPA